MKNINCAHCGQPLYDDNGKKAQGCATPERRKGGRSPADPDTQYHVDTPYGVITAYPFSL